jgi:hypothetical protein
MFAELCQPLGLVGYAGGDAQLTAQSGKPAGNCWATAAVAKTPTLRMMLFILSVDGDLASVFE